MTAPTQQQAVLPGQYFNVPGVPQGATQWTEQDETSVNVTQALSQTSQAQVTGLVQYKQTDVVEDWYLGVTVTQAYTAGTSTLTASPYAPYNAIGAVKQTIQNQYASVDVESGIDCYIFDLMRPADQNAVPGGINNYANPAGAPVGGSATGYLTAGLAQANKIAPAVWSSASSSYTLFLRLPAGQWFDAYYDLAVTGEPLSQPHPALVSPQYMAGTTRVITPSVTFNPGSAAGLDQAAVNIGAGTGTFSGSANLRLRRRAIYAGNPATQPPVYAWQYRRRTQRFGVGGRSVMDIQVPLDTGQLLGLYVRMWDPAANGGLGAPIDIANLTKFQLQYGSGLSYVDFSTIGGISAAQLAQHKWIEQHGNLLPQGVVGVDLALNKRRQLTNANALNTLTTAGILVHLEWSAPLSASAYAVLGTESLVYVT